MILKKMCALMMALTMTATTASANNQTVSNDRLNAIAHGLQNRGSQNASDAARELGMTEAEANQIIQDFLNNGHLTSQQINEAVERMRNAHLDGNATVNQVLNQGPRIQEACFGDVITCSAAALMVISIGAMAIKLIIDGKGCVLISRDERCFEKKNQQKQQEQKSRQEIAR